MMERANDLLGVQFASLEQATAAMNIYNATLRETGSESQAVAAATAKVAEELAGNSVTTAADKASKSLTNLGGVLGNLGNIFSVFGINIDNIIGKFTRLVSSVKSFAGQLGQLGSEIGGSFGGILETVSSFLGGPLGSLAVAGAGFVVDFVSGLFGGKANIEETIARELGDPVASGLSKGLKDSLANLAEQTGSLDVAAQLGLGDIFRESLANGTADLDRFAEQIADTFSFLERGEIDATQAGLILSDTMSQLLPIIDQLGPAGEEQLRRIVTAALATGVEFEGLSELALKLGISMEMTADQTMAAFEAMNGNATKWSAHLQKKTTDAARAMERLQRIMRNIGAGQELGPTQARFAGKAGIPGFARGTPPGGVMFNRPSLISVAEAGPERVQVTPTSGVGASAGGGDRRIQLGPIYITGTNMDTEEIVRKLIPALRLNLGNFGTEIAASQENR
jgi:hypothetical protein